MKPKPRNLDLTYCNNYKCNYCDICARWVDHYDWSEVIKPISVMGGTQCAQAGYFDMIEILDDITYTE